MFKASPRDWENHIMCVIEKENSVLFEGTIAQAQNWLTARELKFIACINGKAIWSAPTKKRVFDMLFHRS